MSDNIVEAMGRKVLFRYNVARTLYDRRNDDIFHVNNFSDWLYNEPWSENKWRQYAVLSRVPVIGDYMDYLLDYRSTQEYFRRYGMDWSDIHDPRKLAISRSSSRLITSVSSNINSLYR